jgi:Frag1/DRAM/Sfk1 family.
MVEWWGTIPSFEKTFWIVAFPSSILFVLQVIMTFWGVEHGADMNGGLSHGFHDLPHEHNLENSSENSSEALDVKFRLFTIRSILAFFTVFSWTGIATTRAGMSHITSIIIAVVLGFILMFIVSFIYYSAAKLTEDGTMDIKNAIGRKGEVYLTIPKKGEGMGKIQIEIQGVLRDMDAITYGEKIENRDKVIVIRIVDNQLLLVEKID